MDVSTGAGEVGGVVADLDAVVDRLAGLDPAGLDDAELRAVLIDSSRIADRLDAVRARAVDAAVTGGMIDRDGSRSASGWLQVHTNLGSATARRIARAARRMSDLPVLAGAWADGRVGLAHVSAVDRIIGDVPLADVAAVDGELVAVAEGVHTVDGFSRLCRSWAQALAPDHLDERDERAWQQRSAAWAATSDGVVDVRMRLDPLDGATVMAALDAFVTPDPAGLPDTERRTIGQRRADAVAAAARTLLGLERLPAGETGGSRPHVVIRANADTTRAAALLDPSDDTPVPEHDGGGTGHGVGGHPRLRGLRPAQVDGIGPVSARVLAEALGDCWLTPLVARDGGWTPVAIGTTARTWTPTQRRIIGNRDRGCRFPGCPDPPGVCEIDHITPADDHGPTHVDNAVTLCRYHHRQAKHPDRWWPTLHPDASVEWTHADGRTLTDPPPRADDDALTRLLDALTAARQRLHHEHGIDPSRPPAARYAPPDTHRPPDWATDQRATYDAGAPPRPPGGPRRTGRRRRGPPRTDRRGCRTSPALRS